MEFRILFSTFPQVFSSRFNRVSSCSFLAFYSCFISPRSSFVIEAIMFSSARAVSSRTFCSIRRFSSKIATCSSTSVSISSWDVSRSLTSRSRSPLISCSSYYISSTSLFVVSSRALL